MLDVELFKWEAVYSPYGRKDDFPYRVEAWVGSEDSPWLYTLGDMETISSGEGNALRRGWDVSNPLLSAYSAVLRRFRDSERMRRSHRDMSFKDEQIAAEAALLVNTFQDLVKIGRTDVEDWEVIARSRGWKPAE